MLRYELTRWLAYRSIEHPKFVHYTWTIPLVSATICTMLFFILPVRLPISGDHGLLNGLVQILSILPGFFIAALAAVATFNRPEMDQEMPTPKPSVMVWRRGYALDVPLTRRTFLTYLFSYLSILSLFLTLFCFVANLLDTNYVFLKKIVVAHSFGRAALFLFDAIFVFFVAYCIASLIVTTLHGIYFLCERMHQPH